MDEQEKLPGEFSLEDILKEFAADPSSSAAATPEEEDVLVLQKIVKDENESKKLECKVYETLCS